MVAQQRLLDDFFMLVASNPSPQQILDYKPSPEDEARINSIIDSSKSGRTTPREQAEIEYFVQVEETVTLAKTKAYITLKRVENELRLHS